MNPSTSTHSSNSNVSLATGNGQPQLPSPLGSPLDSLATTTGSATGKGSLIDQQQQPKKPRQQQQKEDTPPATQKRATSNAPQGVNQLTKASGFPVFHLDFAANAPAVYGLADQQQQQSTGQSNAADDDSSPLLPPPPPSSSSIPYIRPGEAAASLNKRLRAYSTSVVPNPPSNNGDLTQQQQYCWTPELAAPRLASSAVEKLQNSGKITSQDDQAQPIDHILPHPSLFPSTSPAAPMAPSAASVADFYAQWTPQSLMGTPAPRFAAHFNTSSSMNMSSSSNEYGPCSTPSLPPSQHQLSLLQSDSPHSQNNPYLSQIRNSPYTSFMPGPTPTNPVGINFPQLTPNQHPSLALAASCLTPAYHPSEQPPIWSLPPPTPYQQSAYLQEAANTLRSLKRKSPDSCYPYMSTSSPHSAASISPPHNHPAIELSPDEEIENIYRNSRKKQRVNPNDFDFTTESSRMTDPYKFDKAVIMFLKSQGRPVTKMPSVDKKWLSFWSLFHGMLFFPT
jgi:hypothetical protein